MKMRTGHLLGLACIFAVAAVQASPVLYDLNGTYSPYIVSLSFNTSLTGSGLDNLSSDDITATISNFADANSIPGAGSGVTATSVIISTDALGNITTFVITTSDGVVVNNTQDIAPGTVIWGPPPEDEAGFALGDTSNTGGIIFASYPAFAGENPNDFFCDYSNSSGALTDDNDAGFCPGTAVDEGNNPGTTGTGSGTFTSTPTNPGAATTTPEPGTWSLLGAGFLGLSGLQRFRSARSKHQ